MQSCMMLLLHVITQTSIPDYNHYIGVCMTTCCDTILLPSRTYSNFKLKGNSHHILLSEMGLPGAEVLTEKLLPKRLGRLGKENPSKRQCKVAFVQCKCAVTLSVSVRFLYATYS